MYSQLYAKVSIPDIYLISIQANNTGENQGGSFQFNDIVIKIGRELSARRNARFSAATTKRIVNVLADYL
jgi:hypothetical protein